MLSEILPLGKTR